MRIPRIYIADISENNKTIQLTNEVNHYLINVLRLKANHPVILFNGTDAVEFHGLITEISKKRTTIEITQIIPINNLPPINIHLLQALSKGDRFDYAIQKATELGVASITPLITERVDVKLSAERLTKKIQHWQKIVISACEQSNRVIIPKIEQPLELAKFQKPCDTLAFILSPYTEKKLSQYADKSSNNIYIIIGPEGGLTDAEIFNAEKLGIFSINLGPRILRTETAPVAMISLIEYLWGDF
ncbi:16S rRNA (uracil(1498)-N(3))-methyltransferase [Thiotrichales bacterium 19X7-9]|nr:16S rRNA (uracil(1498)-N(3))-methyltransferase [Thiotrichales bacterium 19X7-9]TNF69630.1 MAG: 16S rRNA (uracil(1498)-N(3))-methyltransferase [Gammaproteobacteria bacterium]UTW43407.1 16S rRNA (uracil(1498)-N(3))-methyltransferase [bacterium SCSIO 12844]